MKHTILSSKCFLCGKVFYQDEKRNLWYPAWEVDALKQELAVALKRVAELEKDTAALRL